MRVRAGALVLVAIAGCADPGVQAEPTADARARIEAAIARDQRLFRATADGFAGGVRGVSGAFRADGARFEDRTASWHVDVRLAGIGREDGEALALDGARISADGDRLTRRFAAVDEWWVDADTGFEHGFDVLVPPDGAGALRLVLETDGIAARGTGDGVLFGAELEYRGLFAVDATGRELAAWFEPVTCDGARCEIGIGVDVAGAAWPVTVDPMLTAGAGADAAPSNGADRWYGRAVAVSADTIVVGAPGDPAAPVAGAGAVYVLERNQGGADGWGEVVRIAAPVGAVSFGAAVAVGGDTLVVGAPGNRASQAGAAYVYERSGTWGAAQPLPQLTPAIGDQFGSSVAVYGDVTVAIGAPGRSADAGRVSVFADTGSWTYVTSVDGAGKARLGAAIAAADQRLVVGEPGAGTASIYEITGALVKLATVGAGDPATGFGSAVAVDRDRVVVGAPGAGTAHLFGYDGAAWTEAATLAPTADDGGYGLAVAIEDEAVAVADRRGTWIHEQNARGADTWLPASRICPAGCETPLVVPLGDDGTGAGQVALADHVLVTGAPTADGAVGAVSIRRRTEDDWTFQREEIGAGTVLDLGHAVSVDGDLLVVGAPEADPGGLVDAGSVYLFERNLGGPEQWGLAGQIDGTVAGRSFGWSVSAAGSLLAVGAPNFGGSGHVFTYERGPAGWTLLQDALGTVNGELGSSVAVCLNRVLAGAPGSDAVRLLDPYAGTSQLTTNAVGGFGRSVACDDGRFLVGAPDADSAKGKAYLYHAGAANLTLVATLNPNTPSVGALFGYSVALVGRTAFIGGPYEAAGGAVQVFRETNATTWTFQRELVGPLPVVGDQFGLSVAADGDRLLVGATGRGTNHGALYLHAQNTGGADVWGLVREFDGANSNDRLGASAALVGGFMATGQPGFTVGAVDEGAVKTWNDSMNVLPTAVGDRAEATEDGGQNSGNVLDNDFDGDGDALLVTPLTLPAHGTATMKASGAWTYTPQRDYAGEDSFTYEISDGAGVATATVVIDVAPVNDPPVVAAIVDTVAEEGTVTVTLLGTDVDGTVASYAITQESPNATHPPITGSTLALTPADDFTGVLTLSYVAVDDTGATSAPATITVTVTPVNDSPVAVADGPFTVAEDAPFALPLPGVLGNDTDVDGDTLVVYDHLNVTATVGTVSIGPGGAIMSWTRPQDFTGPAQLTYQAVDPTGARSDPATVTLDVTPVNDAPVATPVAGTMEEGATKAFTLAATDVDDATLTYALTTTSPDATATIAGAQLTVTTVDPNFHGTLSLAYRATDPKGLTSVPAAITITVTPVNDPPVAVTDSYTTPEDEPLVVSAADGLLANDTDADGDALTVANAASLVSSPHGTLTVGTDGSFVFSPKKDDDRNANWLYEVSDGKLTSAPKKVDIIVVPVNDQPVAVADTASTVEGTPVDIDVLANDSDVEDTPLSIVAAAVTSGHGTASVQGALVRWEPGAGAEADRVDPVVVTYTISDGDLTATSTIGLTIIPVDDAPAPVADVYTGDEDVLIVGNVLDNDVDVDSVVTAAIVAGTEPADGDFAFANGAFSWDPPADFFGEVAFAYTVSDGTTTAGPVTVTLIVEPVNDAPRPLDDFAVALEDTPVLVDVLANDADVEGDPLALLGVVEPPAHGVVVAVGSALEWTPGQDRTDPAALVYQVADGQGGASTATVYLAVTPVDDPPVPQPDSFVAAEDESFTDSVLANDSDVDSVPTVALATGPAVGAVTLAPDGTFEWTRPLDHTGSDSFEYTISDATSTVGPVRVDLTVLPVNDAPRPVADAFTTPEDLLLTENVAVNDADPEGDPLTYALAGDAAYGTVTVDAATGDFTYTPTVAHYNGPDSFTYVVSDGVDASGETLVELTILPVDDAPVAVDDAFEGLEDETLPLDVLANDLDVEGDPLTPVVDTPPASGAVTVNADGSLTWVPVPGFFGVDTFTYHVTANGLASAPATVVVTVEEVDDAPIGVPDAFETPVNTVLLGDVLANDVDPNGDALTATLVTDPAHGTLVLLASGSFNYTPLVNYAGPDAFAYLVTARGMSSGPVLVTIDVVALLDTGDTGLGGPDDTGTDLPHDTDPPLDTGCTQTTWYADNDEDGYGNPNRAQDACEAPVGFVALAGDCSDIDPDVNPEGVEIAGNDVDEDCTDGPLLVEGESKGCGCGTGAPAPSAVVLFAALLAAFRRRAR